MSTIREISVFLENKPNSLADLCEILGDAGINILAFAINEGGKFSIMRFILSDVDKAIDLLRRENYVINETKLIGIEVPHRPGELAKIARVFGDIDANIEYTYHTISQPGGETAYLLFAVKNPEKALSAFANHKEYTLLDESKLSE